MHIATVQEKVITWLPKFEFYIHDAYAGMLKKKFSVLTQQYDVDFNGWRVDGNFMGWDYRIIDHGGWKIARISEELFHMTDTYVIDVGREEDALPALVIVIAIDTEKCTASKSS